MADTIGRDDLFIRYELLVDRNADDSDALEELMRVVCYGLVRDIFYVEYIRNQATNNRVPYLLVCVQECNTGGLDAALPENPIVTYNRLATPEIINFSAVQAAVGRVKVDGQNTWAIVDQSRGVHTVFNDEDGNPDPDLN
ncbi:hypothetical protein FS749_000101 [Ceratobasidium sp. UAMH 11750]|nr:hypothetical protein FS749_000101 [Ceratobasidium sp. UAMH 11750]